MRKTNTMPVKQNIKVAVDAVIFGYKDNQLQVLLVQQKFGVNKNKWVLPGGFVHDDESLDQAVKRELKEEAGLAVNYLEQLYSFGAVKRDTRARVISVAYFGLIDPDKFELHRTTDTDAEGAAWHQIDKLPRLGYDHKKIVSLGQERLIGKLTYQPIGFDLLPKEFPFSDLEHLYKTILGKDIDRRNFRKKMMSFGILEETEKFKKIGSGRPAKLFSFNKLKYNELHKEGFVFEIKLI